MIEINYHAMIELLISLGFSEVEAKMYLANLSIGIAGVSILAKRAGMNRTSGYSVLAELKQKWYVKEYLRWNTKYFEATDPEDILDMFHKKIKKLDKALPEIKAMSQKYTESPKVRYYQWLEEVKQLYLKRLQDNPSEIKIFKAWIEREKEKEKLKAFSKEVVKKTWARKVEIICNELNLIRRRGYSGGHERERSFTKNDMYLPTSIKIYGNKVQFVSLKNHLFGVEIENQDIADSLRQMFDYIWRH
jgi:sugar-specific transcriptional regulator TrmB